jgi:fructose-bisphosphate aldolase class I
MTQRNQKTEGTGVDSKRETHTVNLSLTPMKMEALQTIANQMVAPGKGILAADESTGTCTKRFESVGVESNQENRRLYRQMLLTTPGLENYIGGVILYEETLGQETDDGKPFVEVLQDKGIIPGIKVDMGTKDLDGCPGEKYTTGLDGLSERLEKYYNMGARFAKWRSVIVIDEALHLPTEKALHVNAEGLAKYALLCQNAGIVPIVEPETLINGTYSLDVAKAVCEKTWTMVFEQLKKHGVQLNGIILKPSMVIAGQSCPKQASVEEVADATIETLLKCVPKEVPGIAFLSGGQTPLQATQNLQAMNSRHQHLPWRVTFSYGRALQQSALDHFAKTEIKLGQDSLLHRSKLNGAASMGTYRKEEE